MRFRCSNGLVMAVQWDIFDRYTEYWIKIGTQGEEGTSRLMRHVNQFTKSDLEV